MDVDEQISKADDRLLHVWAEADQIDFQKRGRAKAEIERRRREYEDERDARRREHENDLFNSSAQLDVKRKVFEERLANDHKKFSEALADKQMKHASALADKQNATAKLLTRATIYAVVAAGFSALGGVVVAAVELLKFFANK